MAVSEIVQATVVAFSTGCIVGRKRGQRMTVAEIVQVAVVAFSAGYFVGRWLG